MTKKRRLLKTLNINSSGFTLLELLVVIGILAVIVGIVAFSVSRFIGKGACESYCVEKHNLSTAVKAYMTDNDGAIPNLEQAKTYLSGSLQYNWTDENIGGGGTVSDAEDKPEPCKCGG